MGALALVAISLGAVASARAATPFAAEVLRAEMTFADRYWDESVAMLASPPEGGEGSGEKRHSVRETGWYAVGLLERNEGTDRARALRAIEAVLKQQINEPGAKWDGTFYRAPEEERLVFQAEKPAAYRQFKEYDPNWRQFIGTTLLLILEKFPTQIPSELADRMIASAAHAAASEQHDGRLHPNYTNIALMHAVLCSYLGEKRHDAALSRVGVEYMEEVYRGYKAHDSFAEFNSPTYYGVDLYGLALWRELGVTPRMRALGAELEGDLWRDTASLYNANLRNICGPFDRSYGMDMRRYAALTGLWLRLVLPEEVAPFPPLAGPKDHIHDFLFAPMAIALGPKVPAEVMGEFEKFSGDRLVKKTLPDNRVATAWLGTQVMMGAESAGLARSVENESTQYHPITVHWKTPAGGIGWIRLVHAPRMDATAERGQLSIQGSGEYIFRVHLPEDSGEMAAGLWKFPGLELTVETDGKLESSRPVAGATDERDVRYTGASRCVLKMAER